MRKWFDSPLFINASLGFLSLLLALLLIGLFARIIYPRISPDRSDLETHLISNIIQIEVLNGCGVSGIATRFTNALRRSGFDVVESGNFETFDIEHSFVIDRSGNLENARRVAQSLGIDDKRIVREISPHYYLDATVVIGADYEQLKIQ